jgi:predicted metal-dependent enzyme (double-stranded beta helix superfamily)
MTEFTIDGFAQACKDAMASADDPHAALGALLRTTMEQHETEELLSVLDAAISPGADIGEMVFHLSPELTMLFGRIPPRFQSAIHDHTVFACIGQLEGEERNLIYEEGEAGLELVRDVTLHPGEVIDLAADAIHCIENPHTTTGRALHLYGGDFKAVEERRHLWTADEHERRPFSFPLLMSESVRAMRRDGNQAGLDALVEAVPAARPLVEGGA